MRKPKFFVTELVLDEEMNVLSKEELVEKQTQLYCNKLFLSMKKWHEDNGMSPQWVTHYIYETGRKYFKVIRTEEPFTSKNGVQHNKPECVEAFIDRQTGDIFKPASWRKPPKGARINLLDQHSLFELFENLDPFGGHLYKR